MPHRSKIPQTLRSTSCMPYSAGDHMRATGKAAEARVAPLMNRWANVQVYPALLSEYNKKPFGCTMSLHFYQTHLRPNTHLDSPERLRQQSRCKAAVICTAIQCVVTTCLFFFSVQLVGCDWWLSACTPPLYFTWVD